METEFYRFDPVRDRSGHLTEFHRRFDDEQDFTVNPQLVKQLALDTCPEKTPEGKALWLYLRLCQVLKYDEGNFYRDYRHHPNDNPYDSFKVVENVTAETPVTCFNFARIAVKLLNQIDGVHAVMIAFGSNLGHFRFGYYTDRVSVDAEPTTPKNHYNDLARVKLGIKPQGLVIFNGYDTMRELAERVIPPMIAQSKADLRECLHFLRGMPFDEKTPQIDIAALVGAFKQQGIDGATMVQVLFDMNKKFSQPPYQFARTGLLGDDGDVQPQLLVREGQKIDRIELDTLAVSPLSARVYDATVRRGELIYADGDEVRRQNFEKGLQIPDYDDYQVGRGWKIPVGVRRARKRNVEPTPAPQDTQEKGR